MMRTPVEDCSGLSHGPTSWHPGHTDVQLQQNLSGCVRRCENIGRYIEITMNPTMPPTKTIITGSSSEVRAFTLASTSAS